MPGRRLLVVDDDGETLDEVASYLRTHGFRCETALDGHEALKKIVETPDIAILITDIRMPGIDGLEIARYVQENLPRAREPGQENQGVRLSHQTDKSVGAVA